MTVRIPRRRRETRARAQVGSPLRALAISALVAVSAASCATLVRAPASVEAVRLLPSDAAAYARLDAATVEAALSRLPGEARGASAELASRTDAMTIALVYDEARRKTDLLAVAEGRYPAGVVSARLASDKAWRRDGPVLSRIDGTAHLAFADGGRAFVGTTSLSGLLAASVAPRPSPIPDRWQEAWAAPVAIYLPEPLSFIGRSLPLSDSAVPMQAMVLSARPRSSGDYLASLAFEFDSPRSALIFAPLCRVFLYAAASYLWPERSATVLDAAAWTTRGSIVTASSLPLDADAIVAFLGVPGS